METPKINLLEVAIFVCLCSALGVIWYGSYVQPRDIKRQQVFDCMQKAQDYSFESYENCTK